MMAHSPIDPEYVGCVLIWLGGRGSSETEAVLVCLTGCNGIVFLESSEQWPLGV